jgi:hypothetical protein
MFARERRMNDKRSTKKLRDVSLRAVSQLSQILRQSRDRCSPAELERVRKGVGLAIGQVQTEILDMIYARYPELNEVR